MFGLKNKWMKKKIKYIHFVGIGGIGMSVIAEILLKLGYVISGSDCQQSIVTDSLSKLGIKIFLQHSKTNISNHDVVVISTAIKLDNPEVRQAYKFGIPVIQRAEMLAELLKMKFSIAVSGTHGKTTTSAMIASVLVYGKFDPTILIGGILNNINLNARLGKGDFLITEADESDGSFLKLHPQISIITNIDREHLDYYQDLDEIKRKFIKFANQIPFYGTNILCLDDPNIQSIIPYIKRNIISYGKSSIADFKVTDIEFKKFSSTYNIHYKGNNLGKFILNVPGICNIYNSIATVAVAINLNINIEIIKKGISVFSGIKRRLEIKGQYNGVTVIDDYGHHPTEIKVTLATIRMLWKNCGKIIIIFQPHRYTRTKFLFNEFINSFSDANILILTDIYPANEEPIKNIHSLKLYEKINQHDYIDVYYHSDFQKIIQILLNIACPNDIILTQGAGDVWMIGEAYLKQVVQKDK